MTTRLLLALAAATLCGLPAAHAAEVYRWVDDAGKTQFADTVPEKYRSRATRVDTRQAEPPSPAQRALAEERARRTREAAAATASAPAGAISLGGASAASIGASTRPPANDTSDCAGWQRRYTESQECFAPYKLVNGATRPEAFQKCAEVPDPASACGAPRTP